MPTAPPPNRHGDRVTVADIAATAFALGCLVGVLLGGVVLALLQGAPL